VVFFALFWLLGQTLLAKQDPQRPTPHSASTIPSQLYPASFHGRILAARSLLC
jgi:hypothetical protein